ncbi:MAG TPA: signal peptidase II [Vicinamibacterales bacterium]|nr:signal peptidase II [Vicinamibacterales bacterium]HOQ60856.1 signal peptidase II [Vicinamibacterales bacterium]
MSAAADAGPACRRAVRLEAALAAAVILLDQLTKALVRREIPLHDSVPVVPGVLNLVHVRNTGAAFGFLNDVDFPGKAAVVAVVATGALIGIALYAARVSSRQRLARAGLALIIGGAVGNLIDRLAFGSVVDFVDVVFGAWHFWAFNVADSAITVGVAAMLADMMGLNRHAPSTP